LKSAHTTTDTAVVLLLLIVMLPIVVFAGIRNWLLPLDRDTVCAPIDIVAVTPVGNVMYTYRLPAPSGVNDMLTVAEPDAATDTVCGEASVYEPFMTGLNDTSKPPHTLIYVGHTIHLHIPELSSELFGKLVVIKDLYVALLLVCICYR